MKKTVKVSNGALAFRKIPSNAMVYIILKTTDPVATLLRHNTQETERS